MNAPVLQYVAPVFFVAGLDRALAYYRDCLGFAVEFVHGDFYAGIERDGCRIHLKVLPRGWRGDDDDASAERIDACFGTRDARELASQFERRGAAFVVALREMPYGKEFYLSDPDRNVLAFVESAAA